MMCRAVIWLPDAARGLYEVRGERLIDGMLNALRANHIFEIVVLCRNDGDALREWCSKQHLELLITVIDQEDESGSAYRLFEARDAIVGAEQLLYLDGRVAFEPGLLKGLLDAKGSACAVEFETWDATSPRAAVEDEQVVGLSTSLTRKIASGRSLGFYKFDESMIDEMYQSISQQLAYSGDVSTSVEQAIDRLLRSRRIEMTAVPIDPGTWFFVKELPVVADEAPTQSVD